MAVGDRIKCVVSVKKIRYFKDGWGIIQVSLDKVIEGKPIVDLYNSFIVKGTMTEPIKGDQYHLTAKEVVDIKYGKQYEIVNLSNGIDTISDMVGQKKFLSTIFNPKQIKEIYEALPNPFDSFYNGKLEDLVQIKGCGINNAPKWLKRFNDRLPLSKIYIELDQYRLTDAMIKRLFDTYKSADLVIQKVKEDAYSLCEVEGIGWKTSDHIAMSGDLGEFSVERVRSFIINYLEMQGVNGYSYVEPAELMDAIVDTIGEGVSDLTISEAIHDFADQLWWDKDKSKIGLKKFRDLEEKIGAELLRIKNAPNKFSYDNWQHIIKQKELQQGLEYTEQQLEGIKTALENQITVIHGWAGTGKTTIVDGLLAVLKHYSFAQCALSGRASSRMAEITKKEGFTIHRLLGYPNTKPGNKQKFHYHDKNKLPYDIIILDEISMVDGYLFYFLIRALKEGTKFILLGDVGQLESIGCLNIASDLIISESIPTVCLTQIHRQAQASAIITESIKIRQGIQLIPMYWSGVDVRGELQDLLIDCYSDKNNTFYKIMQHFSIESTLINNIMDLQVIVPVKTNGSANTWILNNAIQQLYNPFDIRKDEIDVYYSKSQIGVLRLGDKVINTKNNYNFKRVEDEIVPIFNGNMGVITKINKTEEFIIVDFLDIGEVIIPKSLIKYIELGYAITTHKAQGSQFPRVIIGIDYSSYTLLTKEQLYTAITRAQLHCTLVAQNAALRFGTSQNGVSRKRTHLVDVLNELSHPRFTF